MEGTRRIRKRLKWGQKDDMGKMWKWVDHHWTNREVPQPDFNTFDPYFSEVWEDNWCSLELLKVFCFDNSNCQNSGVNWFHVVQINLFLFVHHCAPLLCEYPWWTFVRLYRLFWFCMYSCFSHLSSSHPVLTLNSSCSLNIFVPSYFSISYYLYIN